MIAFDPDPKLRWLFCMTHPDDEISICAWIKRLTAQGNDVFMSWTHDTPVRMAEARAVAGLLRVPDERLAFHHGIDSRVAEQMPELLPQFRHMVKDVCPDRIACGAFEQGHIDHDATNLLVNKAFGGPVFEIPFYHTYLTRSPVMNRFACSEGEEILLLSAEEQAFKLTIARQYPSQPIWRNLLLDEARRLVTRPRASKLKASERMRLQTHKDFAKPNLPTGLAEAVGRSEKWRRWVTAINELETTL